MINPRYCRKCGVNLPPDSPFCPSCGTAQQTTGKSATSQPSSPPREQPDMGTGRLPAGRMLHNRYRLLEKVGQGGMGAVYVAQDTQLGDRLVAVKEMSMSRLASQEVPPAIEQFKREAHLLASLHHMNLPVIYDHFGEESRWYLVMSFVQGGTLQTYLDTAPSKRLPVNEVIRIGIDLCNVLDYLHTHQPQIIFRDLKPLNIMITPQGQIYLIDFGIARHFKQDQSKDTAYYYSAGYAPPEQYGQSQTGPCSDIYSLGATMHQMLTGHNPASKPFHFPALQLLDPTIPLPLANLIAQMLEMSEPQRPPGMAVVRAELEKVRNLTPIPPIGHVDYAAKKPLQSQQSTLPDEASPQPSYPQDQKSPARPRQNRLSVAGSKQFSFWWIGFSVATLVLGIWSAGSWSILNLDPLSSLSGNFSIPSISLLLAALVGLVFLFSRGQRIVDMIGGIILAILGDSILLLTHKDLSSSYSYPDSGTASVGLAELIISFGSVFLLGLGIYCFTRHAGKRQKIVFGIVLAILGVCQVVAWTRWPNWYYPLDNIIYKIPSIALWLWIGQVVLGIVILIRALRKKD